MNTKLLSFVIIIVISLVGAGNIVSAQNLDSKDLFRKVEKNEKDQPVEIITYRALADAMTPIKRITYTYIDDKPLQKTVYTWDVFDKVWIEDSIVDYVYNEKGDLLSTTQRVWDKKKASWEAISQLTYKQQQNEILLTQK